MAGARGRALCSIGGTRGVAVVKLHETADRRQAALGGGVGSIGGEAASDGARWCWGAQDERESVGVGARKHGAKERDREEWETRWEAALGD